MASSIVQHQYLDTAFYSGLMRDSRPGLQEVHRSCVEVGWERGHCLITRRTMLELDKVRETKQGIENRAHFQHQKIAREVVDRTDHHNR